MDDREFTYLTRRIQESLAIDIGSYKSQQMRRRLDAHVQRVAGGNVVAFGRRLEGDAAAREALRTMLTINVSEFFRDLPQWERLRNDVLPELLRRSPLLRVWSAGCSHGAEPYSIAITLAEMGARRRASILATDLDREMLARARGGGPYAPAEVRNVPPAVLAGYFSPEEGAYRVQPPVRAAVQFRELNLLSDAFGTGFDLVACRNVMIYFSGPVKRDLFRRFHAALKPGGVLFVGATEAVLGAEATGFERMGGNFYRRQKAETAAA